MRDPEEARWLAAVGVCPLAGAPAWSCAAAPVSAAIPTKIKVVSNHFIRIFVSVFDFTLVPGARCNETWPV
jgi:hypothetical protein